MNIKKLSPAQKHWSHLSFHLLLKCYWITNDCLRSKKLAAVAPFIQTHDALFYQIAIHFASQHNP